MVEGLPCHTFPTDDGGVDMKCPTEIAITDRREAELAKNGFMPLSHWKNTDYAVFVGAQSLHKPAEYDDPDATANANLGARCPTSSPTCRFAHFLKCMVRDKIGSFKERADMERWLNNWIMQYVEPDPVNASEEAKARRPLAAAEVVVEEVPGNPGYYSSKFFLRPHYQLEGLTVSLRLVSKLPSEIPTETVSMTAEKLAVWYGQQDENNKIKADKATGWDQKKNEQWNGHGLKKF
jgi:type VI secretion system protein ImpC